MRPYIRPIIISAIILVIAKVLFFGGSITFNELILWAIAGGIIGLINKAIDQHTQLPDPRLSNLVDKVTDHPISLLVTSVTIGLIIGTTIGAYLDAAGIGSIVGGIVGIFLALVWILKTTKS